MEHLTRQQIILLALFVSFFSSIATGIVVVSLMDQSSAPTVMQTVNRVIERTIEHAPAAAKETVIVRDDQAAVSAIAKADKGIVRIKASNRFIGLGVIVSAAGRIVASTDSITPGETLSAVLDGGNIVSVSFVSTDAVKGVSIFQAEQSTDPKSARAYSPVALADSDSIKLGQAAVFISGYETPSVATGIVSSVIQPSTVDPQSAGPTQILASAAQSGSFDSHLILVNLLGEVIGLKDSSDLPAGKASFIPSNLIKTYATATTLHN